MVKPGLLADFKQQVLSWDDASVPIKVNFISQTNLSKRKMHKVVIQIDCGIDG